jgi:UDP-hydrolysing UDP-N-acetyl-D-glucosamine 2-epimerase
MSNKIKICVVTSTRADYGVLCCLLRRLEQDSYFELQLIVTGTHLSPRFGNSIKEIIKDGFKITEQIDMDLISDEAEHLSNSLSILNKRFSVCLASLDPQAVLILGDRFELLPIVTICSLFRTPVIHFNGGEVTSGSVDDQVRHAITKMSHLHFTSTEEFRNRVIRLGEHPDRVLNIGTLGSENIRHMELFSRIELEQSLGTKLLENNILVTFHPESQESDHGIKKFSNLLLTLSKYTECRIIFTYPNTDTGGLEIINLIERFVENNTNAISFKNLGQRRYLSTLKFIKVIIGNSSSGIVEAPSFGISTINIGNRQKGRLMAKSVFNSAGEHLEIKKLLDKSLANSFSNIKNPYQLLDYPSKEVIKVLREIDFSNLFYKEYFE